MIGRLHLVWFSVRSSFWFVPSIMAGAAAALSLLASELDERSGANAPAFVFAGGAEGARAIMVAIAGSMVTVAGTTFSIIIVALSLASQQIGPRLLRNFIQDKGNQIVLGTFIATFLYCLLTLRQIRTGEDSFVPAISVALALLLAIASVAVLIYFVHHISATISVESVITSVANDLHSSITSHYPMALADYSPPSPPPALVLEELRRQGIVICSEANGYIRVIDEAAIVGAAARVGATVELRSRAGHWVVKGAELARVWPPNAGDTMRREVCSAVHLGQQRTIEQDVEFAVNQLVEVAVRALSPGVNDPFTAIACVDRLGSAMTELAERAMPDGYHCDESGDLRLITDQLDFAGVMDAAFQQIRQNAATIPAVATRMLEALGNVAGRAVTIEQQQSVRRHATLVLRSAGALVLEEDVADIRSRYESVIAILDQHRDA